MSMRRNIAATMMVVTGPGLAGCSSLELPHETYKHTVTVTADPTTATEVQTTAVPTTGESDPTPVPTVTEAPSPTLEAASSSYPGNMPGLVKKGIVQGESARYDYPGVTPEEVYRIERCNNFTGRIVLSFDDGGTESQVNAIADTLEENGVGAIFFPNTNRMSDEKIDELRNRGFWVGNHTAKHPSLPDLTPRQIGNAILSGGDATLFRPPYGATYTKKNGYIYFDSRVKEVADTMDIKRDICMWTDDTQDWSGISGGEMKRRILQNLQPGDMILMHMHANNSIRMLSGLIRDIRTAGEELCELPDYPTTSEIPNPLPCEGDDPTAQPVVNR